MTPQAPSPNAPKALKICFSLLANTAQLAEAEAEGLSAIRGERPGVQKG